MYLQGMDHRLRWGLICARQTQCLDHARRNVRAVLAVRDRPPGAGGGPLIQCLKFAVLAPAPPATARHPPQIPTYNLLVIIEILTVGIWGGTGWGWLTARKRNSLLPYCKCSSPHHPGRNPKWQRSSMWTDRASARRTNRANFVLLHSKSKLMSTGPSR